MGELFKFQKEECCEELCADCMLISDYVAMALGSDSEEELFDILMSLFHIGKEDGYKHSLRDSIQADISLLKALEENSCDCPDCCDEKCELD